MRLAEAEEALRAIRSGEVDAIVVSGANGEQVFTLKGADQPYRILIETMNEGTATLLADGTVVYSNSRFADMISTPLELVIGAPFTRFLPPWEHSHFRSLLDQTGRQGTKDEFTILPPDAGGGLESAPAGAKAGVPVQLSVRTLGEAGEDGFCVVITDFTERKRAEEEIKALNAGLKRRLAELAAANRELESFTYSVAHDLRCPMRGMKGFSMAVLEDCGARLSDEGRHYLEQIHHSVGQMEQLIDDLLSLSHLVWVELSPEEVDLSGLAASIAASFQRNGASPDVGFVIEPGLVAEGDFKLLRVVLENLLGNAWKFSAARHPAQIEFGVLRADEDSGAGPSRRAGRALMPGRGSPEGPPSGPVYFVRDNGIGFDMTYAGRLFIPFQRLNSAKDFPGTGIGLATVERIVRKHGGKVWAEGAVDQGATFYFTLGGQTTT
ncbi:MAG TPA: ATP-binding protein [Terriglobia bacterium]|nr:ATP-binding protein [Terriglobia bacterium]